MPLGHQATLLISCPRRSRPGCRSIRPQASSAARQRWQVAPRSGISVGDPGGSANGNVLIVINPPSATPGSKMDVSGIAFRSITPGTTNGTDFGPVEIG